MGGNRTVLVGALALLATGCMGAGSNGKLAIKALPSPLAQGEHPVSFRVAEAAGQFRLGNVALALESYRKALREEPQSVEALIGMAACYDSMGRFDMSRRSYEAALAIAPADRRVLSQFAGSLTQQGRQEEAASVRREIVERLAAAPAQATPPTAEAAQAASAVTVALPAAKAAPLAIVQLSVARPAVVPPAPAEVVEVAAPAPNRRMPERPAQPDLAEAPQLGPRLERLSLGEVALITSPRPVRPAAMPERAAAAMRTMKRPVGPDSAPPPTDSPALASVSPQVRAALAIVPAAVPVQVGLPSRAPKARFATARTPAARFVPSRKLTIASAGIPGSSDEGSGRPLLLLNAARTEGLARRARLYLAARGFATARIGDAQRVRARTIILYPAADRARALRLARSFAVPAVAIEGRPLTILLGRDAAAQRVLRG